MTSTRWKGAVDGAVGELGRLDIIVANAGICSPAPWDQITAAAFRDTIDTNVTGTWNTVMAGRSAHHRRRPRRVDHPHRVGRRHQHAVVHDPLHGEQARRRRNGARIRRRARPAQHPRQQPQPRSGLDTDGYRAHARSAASGTPDTYPHLRGLHKLLLPEGIAQPEDIADAVAPSASDQSRLVTATQVSVDIGVGYVCEHFAIGKVARQPAFPAPPPPGRVVLLLSQPDRR